MQISLSRNKKKYGLITIPLFFKFILLLLLFTPTALASPDLEDLTTYTEHDPNNHITVTSTQITVSQLTENEDAYVYKDFGSGYFQYFENYKLDIKFDGHTTASASIGIFCLSNIIGDLQDQNNEDHIYIKATWAQGAGYYKITLRVNGVTDSATNLQESTWYYLTINRTSTEVVVKIYTDEQRTNLLDTLTVSTTLTTSFRYFYAIASNNAAQTEWLSITTANYDLGISYGAGTYFESVTAEQFLQYYKVSYSSNVTENHKLIWSLNSSLDPPLGELWSNNTKTPKFYIPPTQIKPNSTIFYQAKIYDDATNNLIATSDVFNFTTTITAGQGIMKGWEIVKEGYWTPTYVSKGYIVWDDATNKFYLLNQTTESGQNTELQTYSSTDLIHWTYEGDTLSSTGIPSPWEERKRCCIVKVNSTWYVFNGLSDGSGHSQSGVWTGTSLVNMQFQGFVTNYDDFGGSNCRVICAWYNETDDHWYAYVGGGSGTGGSWTEVRLARSTDYNFTGDYVKILYQTSDFNSGSWADSFVYPPNGLWLNGRFMGFAYGCGSSSPPYDFDADLVFTNAPGNLSITSFYYDNSAADAYGQANLEITHPDGFSMFNKNGFIGGVFSEHEAPKELDLAYFGGFWANETVEVEPGFYPICHYQTFPSESEYKNMLSIKFYIWNHSANITVHQLSGTPPIYASFTISGTSGDTIWVNIANLTTDTVYLKRDGTYIKTLSPTGDGDDFLFAVTLSSTNTFTLESESAPSPPPKIYLYAPSQIEDEIPTWINTTTNFDYDKIQIRIDESDLNLTIQYDGTQFSEINDPNNYLNLIEDESYKSGNDVHFRISIWVNITKSGLITIKAYGWPGPTTNSTNTTLIIRTPAPPQEFFGAGFKSGTPRIELYWEPAIDDAQRPISNTVFLIARGKNKGEVDNKIANGKFIM